MFSMDNSNNNTLGNKVNIMTSNILVDKLLNEVVHDGASNPNSDTSNINRSITSNDDHDGSTVKLSRSDNSDQFAHHTYGNDQVVYNPYGKSLDELPTIYAFNNGKVSDDLIEGIALAEDGEMLGYHLSSNEVYQRSDLGIPYDKSPVKTANYVKHYPNGYVLKYVPFESVGNNPDLVNLLNKVRKSANHVQ